MKLVRLTPDYPLTEFDCGDSDLNDFIMTDAPFYYKLGFAPLSKEDESAETRLLYFDLETLKS